MEKSSTSVRWENDVQPMQDLVHLIETVAERAERVFHIRLVHRQLGLSTSGTSAIGGGSRPGSIPSCLPLTVPAVPSPLRDTRWHCSQRCRVCRCRFRRAGAIWRSIRPGQSGRDAWKPIEAATVSNPESAEAREPARRGTTRTLSGAGGHVHRLVRWAHHVP